eukprot:TRINITY_DN3481_c0_g1_i1.p1 TRINITY_DN3481_c0_g1~~TRINITY_DN3481_c0_g1_i1.p1  ORF type:complete len:120 (+),score=4.41 TRINITY_DN3481_c0_g1_i1:3-362(+)
MKSHKGLQRLLKSISPLNLISTRLFFASPTLNVRRNALELWDIRPDEITDEQKISPQKVLRLYRNMLRWSQKLVYSDPTYFRKEIAFDFKARKNVDHDTAQLLYIKALELYGEDMGKIL